MNKEDLGKQRFEKFVENVGLKAKMRTLITKHYEELADLKGDEFILRCIELIHDEFYTTSCNKEFRGFEYE